MTSLHDLETETERAKNERHGAFDVLTDTMMGMNPSDAIVAQEQREQRRMAESCRVPRGIKLYSGDPEYGKTSKEVYEARGIKILGEADDLFFTAELPSGWKIQPTDHAMWSDIVDHLGRKRFSIFYKGAFYDRKADAGIKARFNCEVQNPNDEEMARTKEYIPMQALDRLKLPHYGIVTMDGKEIWRSEPLVDPVVNAATEGCPSVWRASDKMKENLLQQCRDWLNQNYPKWEDRFASWEY